MTEEEYLDYVAGIRKKIASHDKNQIRTAEKQLQTIVNIRPWRLVYLFAKVELMLKQGYSREDLVNFLEGIEQEYYHHKELVDYYQVLKKVLPDENILRKKKCDFSMALYDTDMDVRSFYQELFQARNQFLSDRFNTKKIKELAKYYYITRNIYIYILLMLLWCAKENKMDIYESYLQKDVFNLPNIGYLMERITNNVPQTFVVVENTLENKEDYTVIAEALQQLGHEVIFVGHVFSCAVDSHVNIEDTLPISIENVDEKNGIKIFYPIEIIQNGETIGNNRSLVIEYITTNLVPNHMALLCCDDILMDELQLCPNLCKNTQRLCTRMPEVLDQKMAFGWTGDYLSYISQIYQFDAHEKINQPAECEFSIVVPARNSVRTLRYTLQTCLEQRFQGIYEIVLSDNSSEGNTEVYDLYKELNDSRIKYFKAPRELNLCKSFEYAFLQAKGEFVFSIGSDDGVLAWSLESLHYVLEKNPQDYVFVWDRGFYAWPGFNYGQQNQFVIPRNYRKGNLEVNSINTKELLENVINDHKQYLYTLPNLYINSGYRRGYLQKMLKTTGRLWDGCCQDIYMGVLNLIVNETITYVSYPITIAGMASSSLGATNHQVHNDLDALIVSRKKGQSGNEFSTYQYNQLEYMFPEFMHVDSIAFYLSFLRLVGMGCLSNTNLKKIDWEDVYYKLVKTLSLDDVLIERKISLLRYAMQQVDVNMQGKIEEFISSILLKPSTIVPLEKKNTRLYQVGFQTGQGGLTLDASEFGVKDIYEATQLFRKITDL